MQRRAMSLLTLGIASFFFIGACMASRFGKTEPTREWAERLHNVVKFNEFAQSHKVHLSGVLLTSYDLTGIKLNSASFEDSEWKGTRLNKGTLSDTHFKKTTLDGVKFQETILSNVTFEDVDLREVSFFKATLKNVKFIRCKLNAVTADGLKNSDIEMFDSKIANSSFSEGAITVTVKSSQLTDVEFTDLEPPSSLTFENSQLKDVDFSRSVLETLILKHVDAQKGGFEGGKIARLDIADSSFGLSFREMELDQVTFQRNTIHSRYNRSHIKQMNVSGCKKVTDFGFFEAKIEELHIVGCDLMNFDLADTQVTELIIRNGALAESDFTGMKANRATFEALKLSQKLDFTNSAVGHLITRDISKQSGTQIITTGSNVKFQ